jgi:hypothetical protein
VSDAVGRSPLAVRRGDGQQTTANSQRVLLISLLFLAPRIALLFVRQPFFDELFTRWISGQPFAGILHALHYDSGPPLYYFIIHVIGDPPLLITRAISLCFASIALIALLRERRFTAAALLAVFPPAVLFAVDARAYALCAMFVTMGVLALDADRPYVAALAFLAAAYSHYYGALFFPLVFFRGRLKPALTLLLFAPGLWLALHQPRASMAWVGGFPQYPDVLFARPPLILAILGAIAFIVASAHFNRFVAMTLIPLAAALAFGIYFPLRFESVIAAPLVLWLATSLERWSPPVRRVLFVTLLVSGLATCVLGIVDHRVRPLDDYHAAARYLADITKPGDAVVATGYLYLEAVNQLGDRVAAFPAEQAQHPGWRAIAPPGSKPPDGTFLWIGERGAPEWSLIRRARSIQLLYANDRAMIARVR